MSLGYRFHSGRRLWGAVIGALGLAALTVLPVGAQSATISLNDCANAGGSPSVYVSSPGGFLPQTGSTMYSGQVLITLFCVVNGQFKGDIANSYVGYETYLPNSFVTYTGTNGAQVTTSAYCANTYTGPITDGVYIPDPNCAKQTPALPVQIPTGSAGQATITVFSTNPQIPDGQWSVTYLDKASAPIGINNAVGMLVATTPELGSVTLFGAGALGLAGYALTRFRARRNSQTS